MDKDIGRTLRLGLSAARWLLAPMYLGLGLLLIVLLIQFVRDFFRSLPDLFRMDSAHAAAMILSFAGVVLIAHVILLVAQTGRELFATGEGAGQIDFLQLRNQLLGSMTALTLLFLLRELAAARTPDERSIDELAWLGAAIAGLVASTLVLALADWFTALAKARRG